MRVQARITLPAGIRAEIEAIRAMWNPERAAGNPAHITIVYHDEAPDPELLAQRLACAAAVTSPFTLHLGAAAHFPQPIFGIYLSVSDPTNGVAAIRDIALLPPFSRRSRFGLHVTLLHPDQGHRLNAAWSELVSFSADQSFEVTELQLVGPENQTLVAFELAQPIESPLPH